MTPRVTEIWRFPIKGHGREPLDYTDLSVGQTMPGDRQWAVAHEQSKADGTRWAACGNFTRVVKAPRLAPMTTRIDDATGRIFATHPERADLDFDPATQGETFIDWVRDFVPENRAQSARLVRSQTTGFTDSDFPSVTLCNLASHRAVAQKLGRDLSIHRWRGNIWMDGLAPWEEFDWVGRDIQIGGATFHIRERTDRCESTHANPETGRKDADILQVLESWGHRDFSVRGEVVSAGRVSCGDEVQVP